ncbi:hypothetical protein M569_04176 [Genlisea aurea]|uniref:Uncharacterized protein n=1 Tax=Genlisea aurea TaxID=192259 RepID=S8EDG4_9LAMI|nr:hypothetical protein M569_04176 [Genlisea aurea]
MRIQPIDSIPSDAVKPAVLKSRLKRLFDRPFAGALKASAAEKPPLAGEEKDEFEPSSVCLDKMVRNFIEGGGSSEKQSFAPAAAAAVKCSRSRCNCFNGNSNDSSDDELDPFSDSASGNSSSLSDPGDALKSLIPCASAGERNLLADTSQIVDKNGKTCRRKDDLRKIATNGLISLGYDASVCRSKWEKSPSLPAGEYEYIDVIVDGERILVDVDFQSEFEIARSTSSYKAILQILPHIFVGKSDRLLQIVSVAAEACRQSLNRKGMHIAPWRKSEYVKSKWLGPHVRLTAAAAAAAPQIKPPPRNDVVEDPPTPPETKEETSTDSEIGELELIFPSDPAVQFPAAGPHSSEKAGRAAVVTGLTKLLLSEV